MPCGFFATHFLQPLFQIPRVATLLPQTDSLARKHLKIISAVLGLQKSLTFHDFRRLLGFPAWGFFAGHTAQGTWPFQCVWIFLFQVHSGWLLHLLPIFLPNSYFSTGYWGVLLFVHSALSRTCGFSFTYLFTINSVGHLNSDSSQNCCFMSWREPACHVICNSYL